MTAEIILLQPGGRRRHTAPRPADPAPIVDLDAVRNVRWFREALGLVPRRFDAASPWWNVSPRWASERRECAVYTTTDPEPPGAA